MTSEVVVMNSLGVALAADSAATVSSEDDAPRKTFNSADKLFMLSKRHPVGVMVYANAAIMGVPWETVIKMFRRQLDGKFFPHLEDYGRALVAYLNDRPRLFPEDVQRRFFLQSIEQLFTTLDDRIESAVFKRLIVSAEPGATQKSIATEIILKERDRWARMPPATCLPDDVGPRLTGRYSGQVHDLILKVFGHYGLEGGAMHALYELIGFIVGRERIYDPTFSGIVVAGFGEDEHFPVMQTIQIGHVYEDRLKCRYRDVIAISDERPAHVEPFADGDMVKTFLHGINPRFEVKATEQIAELIFGLPNAVVDAVEGLTAKEKTALKAKFRPEARNAFEAVYGELNQYREAKHLEPIRQAIANMPKDELGHAAARLVSLNWFEKRMSLAAETVGGPVDVAVISKGDGFIWIDRKHYFKRELNPHFFTNYHYAQPSRGDSHEEEERDEAAPKRRIRAQPGRGRDGGASRASSTPAVRPRGGAERA